jgi:hypothetical protein
MDAAPSERAVHSAVLCWLRAVLPGQAYIHHSPNEGRRGWKAQADIKALGVMQGHPDLEILYDGCAYFLEVKRPPPAKTYLTPAQRDVHARLIESGAKVAVVRSIDDAREAIASWSIPTKERAL